jgi:hypothetical protein
MDLDKIVIPLLLLIVFGVVAVVLTEKLRRRRPTLILGLQQCPDCKAHNPKAREHCYACGFAFILSPSDGPEVTVVQRVKQADASEMRRRVGTQVA